MAKRRINPSIGDVTGTIGNLVHYERNGQLLTRRTPVRQKPFKPAELANQNRLRLAAQFAAAVLSDAGQRARYQRAASGTDASAQNIAVSDFFHSPVVTEADLSTYTGRAGEFIRIRVEEGRIGAAEVTLAIADRAKTVLESGSAFVTDDAVTWWYAAQKDLPPDQPLWITITAVDQPLNRTTKVVRHFTGV
jgi:hypothetical protein